MNRDELLKDSSDDFKRLNGSVLGIDSDRVSLQGNSLGLSASIEQLNFGDKRED